MGGGQYQILPPLKCSYSWINRSRFQIKAKKTATTTMLGFKGQFTPESEIHVYPLTCIAIDPSSFFLVWAVEFFPDIGWRDVCLLSNIIETDCTVSVGGDIASEFLNAFYWCNLVPLYLKRNHYTEDISEAEQLVPKQSRKVNYTSRSRFF